MIFSISKERNIPNPLFTAVLLYIYLYENNEININLNLDAILTQPITIYKKFENFTPLHRIQYI